MIFEELLLAIEELKGKPLQSLGRGAAITLENVDRAGERIELKVTGRSAVSRSFKEIRKLWQALQSAPFVHVDTVLAGSGSSRNQPETIFANLPFVEYLVVNQRKHIAFVGERTHSVGSTRKMDAIKAQELIALVKTQAGASKPPAIAIISDRLAECVKDMEKISGADSQSLGAPGLYSVKSGFGDMILVDAALVNGNMSPGCYPVVNAAHDVAGDSVFEAGDFSFSLVHGKSVQALAAKRK